MSTQVILLERVEKLGNMGDVVTVKPGYARNYLLPEKKALRASKDNVAYFEAQKKVLLADNDKQKAEAEKFAKKIADLKVPLIRAASESGQLYGSVNTRDIAQEAATTSGESITRPMIKINQNFKTIGLFPVNVQLHPEVVVVITVNIARSPEEAEIQARTGKALVADDSRQEEEAPAATETEATEGVDEDALADVLEEGALEAEKEKAADAEAKAAEEAVKAEERAVKKAEKDAAKAAAEAEEAAVAEAEAAENPEAAEAPAEEEKAEDAE